MSFLLHQALPVFVLPTGVSLIAMLGGLLTRRRGLVWAGVAVYWICSMYVVSGALMRAAEGSFVRVKASDAPTADAIVALSYGRLVAPGPDSISEWRDADRFFGGVELFKAGKAPLLVFTGGGSPWEPEAAPEGDVLRTYAAGFGVPVDRILTTGFVVNTAAEAAAVGELLHGRLGARPHILLVTSAYHIPRAQRLFERAGFVVTPFPVDFSGSPGTGIGVMDVLPTASALEESERALREIYGRLFYLLFPPPAAVSA